MENLFLVFLLHNLFNIRFPYRLHNVFFKLLILEEEYYSNLISTLSKIEFFMEKLPFAGTLIGSKNGLNKTFLNGV